MSDRHPILNEMRNVFETKKIRIEVKPFDANWKGVTESYNLFQIKTSNQAKKKR